MNKILFLPIFALLLVFAASIGDVDAKKSDGTKNPVTGSDQVCGDRLCSEIEDLTHSTFTVGGVAQQASFSAKATSSDSKYIISKVPGKYVAVAKTTICHNGHETMSVAEKYIRSHMSHGDTLGACEIDPYLNNNGDLVICHKDQTYTSYPPHWLTHKGHGDTLGACPLIATLAEDIPYTTSEPVETFAWGSGSTDLDITIHVGDTIAWKWDDDDMKHDLVPDLDLGDEHSGFGTGLVESPYTYKFKFTEPGTYHYYCTPHPWMTGKVVVLAEEETIPEPETPEPETPEPETPAESPEPIVPEEPSYPAPENYISGTVELNWKANLVYNDKNPFYPNNPECDICEGITTVNVGDTILWNFTSPGHNLVPTAFFEDYFSMPLKTPSVPDQNFGTNNLNPSLPFERLAQYEVYPYTFTEPGTYHHLCQPHSYIQNGIVEVKYLPATPTITSPMNGDAIIGDAIIGGIVTLSGDVIDDSVIEIFDGERSLGYATVDYDNDSWMFTTQLSSGMHSITASASNGGAARVPSDPLTLSIADSSLNNIVWDPSVSNGIMINGNSLIKTDPDGWKTDSRSIQSLNSGNGYVEIVASETTTHKVIGLDKTNSSNSFSDIDYGIYMHEHLVKIYEKGMNRGGFGSYATGDIFKVEVDNGTVKYSKNGSVFYTSTIPVTSDSYPMYVDAAIYDKDATVESVSLTIR